MLSSRIILRRHFPQLVCQWMQIAPRASVHQDSKDALRPTKKNRLNKGMQIP